MRILLALTLLLGSVGSYAQDKLGDIPACEAAALTHSQNLNRRNALIRAKASELYQLHLFKSPAAEGATPHYIALFIDRVTPYRGREVPTLPIDGARVLEQMNQDTRDFDNHFFASLEVEPEPLRIQMNPAQRLLNKAMRYSPALLFAATQYDLSFWELAQITVATLGMHLTSHVPQMVEKNDQLNRLMDRFVRGIDLGKVIVQRLDKVIAAGSSRPGAPVYAVFTDPSTAGYVQLALQGRGYGFTPHYDAPYTEEEEQP